MSFIVPTAAELDTLTDMIASIMSGSFWMRLYASSVTINTGTTLASLNAVEATFTGYSAQQLTTWSTPAIDGSSAAATLTTQGQFTPTAGGGSGNVYGYYISNAAKTKFYGAEQFSGAPITIPQNITLEVDFTYTVLSRF
jgi:hypothetical protein